MKRRLPPSSAMRRGLKGPNVRSYTVGSWCQTPDGSGPATAVAISIELEGFDCEMVLRLKTPEAVDTMIQSLLRHKRDVWPESR